MPHRTKDPLTLGLELLGRIEEDPEDTMLLQVTSIDLTLIGTALTVLARMHPLSTPFVNELVNKILDCGTEQGFLPEPV